MSDQDWFTGYVRSLGMLLDGQAMTEWADSGEMLRDDALLVLLNAWWGELGFTLPAVSQGPVWRELIDTAVEPSGAAAWAPGARYPLQPRSLALLSAAGGLLG